MQQQLKNVFEKTFLTISVDSANKWVHTNWIGYLSEDNIKLGAFAYSQVVGSWNHSLDWVINEWNRLAAKAGIKYLAQVEPSSIYTSISIN